MIKAACTLITVLTWYWCSKFVRVCGDESAPELIAAYTWGANKDNGTCQSWPWIQLGHFLICGNLLSVKVLPFRCRIENLFSAALACRQLGWGQRAQGGRGQSGVAYTHTSPHTYPRITTQLHVWNTHHTSALDTAIIGLELKIKTG